MIPYEELERALARWKARRSGAVESTESSADPDADATPSGLTVVSASSSYDTHDSTGELDLSDADVDHS